MGSSLSALDLGLLFCPEKLRVEPSELELELGLELPLSALEAGRACSKNEDGLLVIAGDDGICAKLLTVRSERDNCDGSRESRICASNWAPAKELARRVV